MKNWETNEIKCRLQNYMHSLILILIHIFTLFKNVLHTHILYIIYTLIQKKLKSVQSGYLWVAALNTIPIMKTYCFYN